MPYDLYNETTTLCRTYSKQFFAKALELGQLYGWKPAGTLAPADFEFYKPIADWHGWYLTNDGQKVLDNDACLLADALEKSLSNIADEIPNFDWNPKCWTEDDLPDWFSPEEKEIIEDELQDGLLDILGISPIQYFSGIEKRYLIEFIRFCRLGNFLIL